MIDAREAHRIGLVNKVVPAGDLLAAAEKTLRGILAMGPLAVRLALEAVDQGLEMTLDEGLLLEANRSEEHTSELQSRLHLVCRLLLEKKKTTNCTELPTMLD